MNRSVIAAIAGAAGATALTLAHEAGRHILDDAPRLDVLGKRALRKVGVADADPATLDRQALTGDLAANSMYYSMVGTGASERIWARGLTLGLLAGVGALLLPRPLGLGDPPSVESPRNRVLTLAYYTLGGLVSAATADALQRAGRR